MEIYKQMYLMLFNDVTTAVELLQHKDYSSTLKALNVLLAAQVKVEELFIKAEETFSP